MPAWKVSFSLAQGFSVHTWVKCRAHWITQYLALYPCSCVFSCLHLQLACINTEYGKPEHFRAVIVVYLLHILLLAGRLQWSIQTQGHSQQTSLSWAKLAYAFHIIQMNRASFVAEIQGSKTVADAHLFLSLLQWKDNFPPVFFIVLAPEER